MFTVPSTRRALVVSIALVAVSLSGCAARPDRFARFQDHEAVRPGVDSRGERRVEVAAPPDVRRGELTGRSGYATFGTRVRLSDDPTSLTHVLAVEREAMAASRRMERFDEEREHLAGPEGMVGYSAPAPYPNYSPGFAGPYFGPYGAVPPGLRPGFDSPVPAPIFTAPSYATPGSDVWRHRPGLSTGSGIYARPDSGRRSR